MELRRRGDIILLMFSSKTDVHGSIWMIQNSNGLMPESLRLAATMVQLEQGKTAQSLLLD